MATGGTGGMKYTIQMDIQANTKAVGSLTQSVDTLAKSLANLQKQGDNAGKGMAGGLASANAQGYFLASTLERAGRQSLFFAKAFASATVGSFTTLLHEAANLEQFIIRLQSTQGTTKKDALDIFNYTIKATTHLPITEAQLVRIATTFKQRGMDIREAFHGKTYEDIIKSGHAVEGLAQSMGNAGKEGVGLLDLFSDLATTQGQLATEDIGKFVREFSEFMATGQTRFLRTRLDPALLHELNSTKANAGKAMDVIYEYLAKRNALGVSRLSMQTFSGVTTNFKGLPQRIANAVFQPGLAEGMARKFSLALAKAFETINEYFDESTEKGKRFLPELRKIFDFIGGVGISVINGLTKAFERMANFMINNPGLGKFLTMVGSILAGLLALRGVMFLFRASLITIALAGKLVAGVTAALNISTGLLALKYAGLIAIGGIFFAMFRKVGMVISAVHEAMTSFNPNTGIWTIARKTYDELQKGGLMGLFEKLLEVGLKLKLMFEDKLSMEKAFPTLAAVRNFLRDLGDAFVHVVDVMLGVRPAANVSKGGMAAVGTSAGNLSVAIQRVSEVGSELAKTMSKEIPTGVADAIDWFATLIEFSDKVIRYALNPLLFALSGVASAVALVAASIAVMLGRGELADKMTEFAVDAAKSAGKAFTWYNPERDEDTGELNVVKSLRGRATALRAGLPTATGPERGIFPEVASATLATTYVDPATGQSVRVPYAGISERAGVSYDRSQFPATFAGGFDPLSTFPALQQAASSQKVTVNSNVFLDGRQIAAVTNNQAIVERDRRGDTLAGNMTPMSSLVTP